MNKEETSFFNVELDVFLIRKIKAAAALEGQTLKEYVNDIFMKCTDNIGIQKGQTKLDNYEK